MTGKTMTPSISALLTEAAKKLTPRKITCEEDHDTGRLEAEVLLGHLLNKDRAWLIAHADAKVPAKTGRRFSTLVKRRMKHEPVAYIIGTKDFYGRAFRVNRHVLIPRPDSELLVELATKRLFPEPSSRDLVWDVGTGSGALAISIAHEIAPRRVIASDISKNAITVAKENARTHHARNITFIQDSLLGKNIRTAIGRINPKRLVIVANLPYLPQSDKQELDADVVKFEPSSALFSGRSGLDLIEKFLRQLAAFGIAFDALYLEYDPPQTKKIRALVRAILPRTTVTVHRDLAKRDRVMEIRLR